MDNSGGNWSILFWIVGAALAGAFVVPSVVIWWLTRSWLWAPLAGAGGVGCVLLYTKFFN